MNFKTFKTLAALGAATLALSTMSGAVKAADNADVTASLTTHSSITAANGTDMDFGRFLIIVRNSETPTIEIPANSNTYAIVGATQSTVVPLDGVNAGVRGTATVTLPTGADNTAIQVTLDSITDFAGAALDITAASYSTATETGNNALPLNTGSIVTTVTGGTPETVTFGATVTANSTPTDGSYSGALNITFDY